MPYVVTMKYIHPTENIQTFPMPEDFKTFKIENYNKTGKIIAQDYSLNQEQKTETVTIVFKDKQTFDEWSAEPIVTDFFQKRDEFLRSNLIYKVASSQEI